MTIGFSEESTPTFSPHPVHNRRSSQDTDLPFCHFSIPSLTFSVYLSFGLNEFSPRRASERICRDEAIKFQLESRVLILRLSLSTNSTSIGYRLENLNLKLLPLFLLPQLIFISHKFAWFDISTVRIKHASLHIFVFNESLICELICFPSKRWTFNINHITVKYTWLNNLKMFY